MDEVKLFQLRDVDGRREDTEIRKELNLFGGVTNISMYDNDTVMVRYRNGGTVDKRIENHMDLLGYKIMDFPTWR